MTQVNFFDIDHQPPEGLTYSVIVAYFNDNLILVKHQDRDTWEIPGGHIEMGESPDEAAARELKEETGATDFTINCIATYSVLKNGKVGFGRLFAARVTGVGEIGDSSEISEVIFSRGLPEDLTYPDIQPLLLARVEKYLRE
jgi:8-oxo-dGTP diphosphatase